MNNKKYYIAHYDGSATYEPAEGGYYVPERYLTYVTVKGYKLKHAKRVLAQTIAELTEELGEPDYRTAYTAHWTTGDYVGDEYLVAMTAKPERYEDRYEGYR